MPSRRNTSVGQSLIRNARPRAPRPVLDLQVADTGGGRQGLFDEGPGGDAVPAPVGAEFEHGRTGHRGDGLAIGRFDGIAAGIRVVHADEHPGDRFSVP